MAVTMLSSESDLISAQMFQDCLHQAVRSIRDRSRDRVRDSDRNRDRERDRDRDRVSDRNRERYRYERALPCIFHSMRYAV